MKQLIFPRVKAKRYARDFFKRYEKRMKKVFPIIIIVNENPFLRLCINIEATSKMVKYHIL